MIRSFFQNFKRALTKTRSKLTDKIYALFNRPIDTNTEARLEEILYEADLGSHLTEKLMEEIRPLLRSKTSVEPNDVLSALRTYSASLIIPPATPPEGHPHIILMIGVNGSGKTTSCAKLAKRYAADGKKVLLAAADTFRAAAIEQLSTWAERLNLDIVKGQPGGDPAATLFDAIEAARARNCDVVIVDTAGRLQSKTELMRELEKLRRICHKQDETAPHETLLVLDATTGQNGLDQAENFHSVCPLTGIVLTKLDGSAKGGIALAIGEKLKLPVRYVGLGEGADDFDDFDGKSYLDALFSL